MEVPCLNGENVSQRLDHLIPQISKCIFVNVSISKEWEPHRLSLVWHMLCNSTTCNLSHRRMTQGCTKLFARLAILDFRHHDGKCFFLLQLTCHLEPVIGCQWDWITICASVWDAPEFELLFPLYKSYFVPHEHELFFHFHFFFFGYNFNVTWLSSLFFFFFPSFFRFLHCWPLHFTARCTCTRSVRIIVDKLFRPTQLRRWISYAGHV